MAPAASPLCNCPCCQGAECTCEGKCHCDCCKRKSCSCDKHRHAEKKQEEPCKCACCEKKQCSCKQPSDCGCPNCVKKVQGCPSGTEKKAGNCQCHCCKTGTRCTEESHHQNCDCMCCKEKTCSCCKSKEGGASCGAAKPAAGKTSWNVLDGSCAPPSSSISRPNRQQCNSCDNWSADCSNNCSGGRGHCQNNFIPQAYCYINHTRCWRSRTTDTPDSNTEGCQDTQEEDMHTRPWNSCNFRLGPPFCFPSYIPCRFVAPAYACRCCSCKQHLGHCHSQVCPCGGVSCFNGHGSSNVCGCGGSILHGTTNGVVTRAYGAGDSKEASEKDGSCTTLVLRGTDRGTSSTAEPDSEGPQSVKCFHAPKTWTTPAKRCNCRCQWRSSGDVAAKEQDMPPQKVVEGPKGPAELQHKQHPDKYLPPQLQEPDQGQQTNTCIIDPEGRLVLECKTKEQVLLRRMQAADYPAVRALLPRVSSCTLTLDEQQVCEVLSSPVFYAWCCFTVEPSHRPLEQQQVPQRKDVRTEAEARDHKAESQAADFMKQQQTRAEQRQEQSQQPQEQEGQQVQEISRMAPGSFKEKKLVAYCELVLQPRLGRKTDGRLERVVVDEAFCGRGVASQMCSAVLAAIKKRDLCGIVELTVEKEDARHIYEEKLGFRKRKTIVMRRQL